MNAAKPNRERASVKTIGIAMTCLALMFTSVAGAEDHVWSSLGGGSFNYWLNWVPNFVPGEDDAAIFELGMDPAYQVTFYESVTNERCIFRHDKVNLDLGGFTYTLTYPGWGLAVGEDFGQVAEVLFQHGTLDTDTARIGTWAGSSGTLELVSPLTMNVALYLLVGNEGDGQLIVNDGVSLTADYVSIGAFGTTNVGSVILDGPNADFNVNYQMTVGDNSFGSLDLDNGANVNAAGCYAGGESTGYGIISITAESEFVADWLSLGRSGSGTLTVSQAGRLDVGDLHVGAETGDGSVELYDVDSRIDATGYIFVGSSGYGMMNLSQQAAMTADTLSVGHYDSAEGELNIFDAGTAVTVQNNLLSGLYGVGTISITGGADVRTTEPGGWIKIGDQAGADGYILVDGGSTLAAEQAPLVVGGAGSARMDILGGSEVHTSGELFMGWAGGGVGQLTISGAGSKYFSDSGYPALVGDEGEGTLIVGDGGSFDKPGGFRLGLQSTGVGVVTLIGDESTFKVGEHLGVGEYGVGRFYVNDGRVAIGEIDPADVPSGEVHIAGWAHLAGAGTLTGDVVNLSGWVMPGGEPGGTQTGVLTIDGNYTQQDATLAIRVKGTLLGDEYSSLNVTGAATIANALEIQLLGGYFPQAGEQYVILTADSIDGTFPAVFGPGWYDVTYNADNVTVTVLMSPGDFDGDGDVDLSDLAHLLGYYGTPSGASYQQGDIDGDGDVDLSDLATLLGYYGSHA